MIKYALLLLGLVMSTVPAAAASAGYCLAQCNARCYGNGTPSCSASCTQRCMFDSPGAPSAPATYWGAIAAGHPPDGSIGYSTHYQSEGAARARALVECRKIDTGKCDPLVTFSGPFCGAAATAWKGDDSLGTYADTATSRGLAEQLAMRHCQAGSPGAKCEMLEAHCASE